MSGLRSRSKGKRGERELCSVLCAAGFPATRGAQHRGGPDSPDVRCDSLPAIHWEVKRCERINLYDAMAQAERDAKPIDDGEGFCGRIPVVAHRKNDSPWLAVLRMEDFLAILGETELVREKPPTLRDCAELVGGEIVGVEVAEP